MKIINFVAAKDERNQEPAEPAQERSLPKTPNL